MQNRSNAYETKFNSGDYEVIYKFRINDDSELEYTDDNILGGRITEAEFSAFSIGNFISRTLETSFLDDVITVPKRAKIDVSYTIGESANSWKPKGTFYVDKRQRNESEVSLIAYDAALKASVPFIPEGTWAQTTALEVFDELIGIIDVGYDGATRSMISSTNYILTQAPDIGPDGTTVGEMIGYLAAIYGCNAVIDEFENLKFIKPFGNTVGSYEAEDISLSPVVTVDRVMLHTDRDVNAEYRYPVVSDEAWDAMTGYIVEGTSIFANQTIANAIGAELVGKTYQGFSAQGVLEDPAIQIGDIVTVEGADVMVVKRIISFDDDAVELSAPYEEEIESEYPKPTPTQRQIQKEKARRMASISVLEDQIELKVDASDFEAAEATNYQSITPMYLANDGTRTPSVDDPNWSTTPPQLQEGQHMWTMTVYVRKSGATSYSQPMDITGTEGAAGRGIERVENFYQVSSSGDTAPSTWPAAGVIPQMTATNRFLWGYETTYYTDNTNESTTPHVIGVYGQTGQNGNDAYNYELIVSNPVIVKSEAGAYNPTSIVLTAKRGQGTGSPANYSGRFKIESTTNNSTWTSVYTSSSNEATRTQSVPNNIIALRCSLYLAGGTTTLLDQQTVPIVSDGATGPQGNAGADGYTVLLSNENHSFAAGTSAATATNITVNVLAYKGATQIAATIGTITGQVTGLTTSLVNNGTTSAGFKVTVTTSLTTKSGQLTIPVTVDGKSFTKIFSWSLALTGQTGAAGDDGDDGVGIASITEYYGRSRVSTTEPTASGDAGSWSTTYQTVDSTWKFLWNYEVVAYTDNTSFTSQKRIIGTYAQDGTDGRNPIAFDQYLCANEDPDNPPAASANWIHVSQFNLADYQDDENHHYYIWTKTKTTWDVGEPTWTEPYLDTYYVNVTAQFNVLTGSINSSVKEVYDAIDREATARKDLADVVDGYGERISTVESLETTVTQTASGLEAITTRVTNVEGELQEQANYMRWHGDAEVPYLEIGQSNASVHTEMRGNAFAVVTNNEDSMVADESGVTARAFKAAESVDIGRFRWVDEGSLGFSLI